MAANVQIISNPVVNVFVSEESNNFKSERRLNRDLEIHALKCKLEMITGMMSGNMELELYASDDTFLCNMCVDNRLLGSYPVDDLCRIHVKTKQGATPAMNYEDTSKVEKYEMPDEEYNKRTDSVRAFKERAKALQSEEEIEKKQKEKEKLILLENESFLKINIGDRCEVTLPNQPAKRGVVMFKGETQFQNGRWIGVKYDEPLGKNDGSVKGVRYFECGPKYGGFVKSSQLECGDFPEKDLFDELEM